MTAHPPDVDADLAGPASPPRDNGDIIFGAPWERRVFGLTVAACRSGALQWEAFRDALIAHIANDDSRGYWHNWTSALQETLEDAAVLTRDEIVLREHELFSRPAGFDHHAPA
jgi:hypothetical protein